MFYICIVILYGTGLSIAISGVSTLPPRPAGVTDEFYKDFILASVSFKLCMIGLGILVSTALTHVLSKRRYIQNDRIQPLEISPTAVWAVRTALKN